MALTKPRKFKPTITVFEDGDRMDKDAAAKWLAKHDKKYAKSIKRSRFEKTMWNKTRMRG